MSYRSIMVHLELEHSNDARLAIAADLASRFDARLIGLAACDPVPPYYARGAVAAGLIEKDRQELQRKMKELEDWFREVARQRAKDVQWRTAFAAPAAYMAREGRAADLLIVGTNRDETLNDPLRRLDAGDLLMQAGRPVLVVPPEVESLALDRVLVAWKDSVESRRAIAAALPVLKLAGAVHVVEIVEHEDSHQGAAARVNDVSRWLGTHGIEASARTSGPAGDVADELQDIAETLAANLIVAGGYGRSRLREWVFGGVTRELLECSPLCSLLAH